MFRCTFLRIKYTLTIYILARNNHISITLGLFPVSTDHHQIHCATIDVTICEQEIERIKYSTLQFLTELFSLKYCL